MDFINRSLAFRSNKRRGVEISLWANRKHILNGGARFAKHVEKYIIELKDGKAILSTVLLTDRDIGKLVANG